MYIKFGFGRATRVASRLIKEGHMTRAEGEANVLTYDGEFPNTYLQDCLDYMGMDMAELHEAIDTHRNPEMWKKDDNGLWVLA